MYIPFISISTTWRNCNSSSGKHQASCRRIHKLFQNENCYWSQNAGHALVFINNNITLIGTSRAFKWKGRSSKWSFPCTCGSLKTRNKPEPGKLSKDRKTRQNMKESGKKRGLKQLQAERGGSPPPNWVVSFYFVFALKNGDSGGKNLNSFFKYQIEVEAHKNWTFNHFCHPSAYLILSLRIHCRKSHVWAAPSNITLWRYL